jgi:hypothetical protein
VPAPPATTTKPVAPTTTTSTAPISTAIHNGQVKSLTAVGPGQVDTLLPAGTITGFASTNPAFACLDGKTMAVYQYGLLTGKDVAVATTPTDCVTQDFTFPA